MKTKQDFIDFLDSYRLILKMGEENEWTEKRYYEDTLQMLLDVDNSDSYFYREPSLSICVSCNSNIAELVITCGLEYEDHICQLANEVKEKNFNFRKFKHRKFSGIFGSEIRAKGEFSVIRDAFIYCVGEINKNIEN